MILKIVHFVYLIFAALFSCSPPFHSLCIVSAIIRFSISKSAASYFEYLLNCAYRPANHHPTANGKLEIGLQRSLRKEFYIE